MKFRLLTLACLMIAAPCFAQRHKVTIDTGTKEGTLLQEIGEQTDEAQKIAKMEQFVTQYPKHEGIVLVYELMVTSYAKAGQPDKAMSAGEQLLALDPEDAQGAHEVLKVAEAKKDPDAVKKWAVMTSEAARKVVKSKAKEGEEEEDWKHRLDFAKQVDVYTEYSLFWMLTQTADPKKKIELAETLAARNPDSQYLAQVEPIQFLSYLQTGENEKAAALAETAVAKNRASEEMLVALAGHCRAKKETEKARAYAQQALATIAARPKPENIPDADWQKRKSQLEGRANFFGGVALFDAGKWMDADKMLRAALPGIKDDVQMTAEALFSLGVANYRIGDKGATERIKDALVFSQQCAAIKSRFQAPAQTNIRAIRSQYRVR